MLGTKSSVAPLAHAVDAIRGARAIEPCERSTPNVDVREAADEPVGRSQLVKQKEASSAQPFSHARVLGHVVLVHLDEDSVEPCKLCVLQHEVLSTLPAREQGHREPITAKCRPLWNPTR